MPPTTATKLSGMSNLEAGIWNLCAMPCMMGMKMITTGILFKKALINSTVTSDIKVAIHNLPMLNASTWREKISRIPVFTTP